MLKVEATAERLAALYDAVLPGLARRYEAYLEETDPILDAPSLVIVDRILADLAPPARRRPRSCGASWGSRPRCRATSAGARARSSWWPPPRPARERDRPLRARRRSRCAATPPATPASGWSCSDTEMHEYEGTHPLARREMVHRHMSNEITSLDIAAQCLAEFPDAPWELRLELARQCWDESRHVSVLARRLPSWAARKGEFPISAFEWNVTCAIDDLPGRLATQNRTFEAGAMDVVGGLAAGLRAAGDPEHGGGHRGHPGRRGPARALRQPLDQAARRARTARVLLKVVAAVRFLAQANAALQASAGRGQRGGRGPGRPRGPGARGQHRGPPAGGVHRRGDPGGPAAGGLPLPAPAEPAAP